MMYVPPKEHRIEVGDVVSVRYLPDGPTGSVSNRTGVLVGSDASWLLLVVSGTEKVKSIRASCVTVVNLVEKGKS